MPARDAKGTLLSRDEEGFPLYFSEWLKRRRQELDLTQEQLAKQASCSVFAIRKIEMGERRPSRQLAELLAKSLQVPPEEQATFVKVARGELGVERLASPERASRSSRKPDSPSGNIPRLLTRFIGREPELNALGQLLRDPQCRLLTIVGPGGIGKTRLAVEAAHQSTDLFPDGAWFVPLASLTSPALIVPAIADAVNFKFQEPTNLQGQLLHHLRPKRALLVLDNAEHLLQDVGLYTEILKDCSQVKLLVTSRERLNLLSEWVFEIQGLPVPASDQVEQFEAYSSIALFLQSAERVCATFEMREADKPWVLKICQVMEGMPLGIELSAAWVGILSCEAIAREIESNLDFLTATMRDLPERHRSLRATLDHSWGLLNAEERLILSRLAVFRGSFSREAAHEICGASLAVLSSLRNKSLLNRVDNEFYSLHEIIRQYASSKLAEYSGELERIKNRHAAFFVQLLANWEKDLQGSRQLQAFNDIARIVDDLSQAWQWMITHCRPGAGVNNQTCAALIHSALFSLSLFYEMRCRSVEALGLFKDSVDYLRSVQGEFENTEDWNRFISVLGHITGYLGLHHYYLLEMEKCREYLEEALRLLEESQSWVEKAQAQVMIAGVYDNQGRLQKAAALLEQSREVFRKEGADWWYLLSTVHLAINYYNGGKFQESDALLQEGFQLLDPGEYRIGTVLRSNYAYTLIGKDPAKAEQLLLENLELCYLYANQWATSSTYLNLGRLMFATHRIDQAVEHLQKSIALLYESRDIPDDTFHRLYLGKCFAALQDRNAALDQYWQVIQTGQIQDKFFMIYWAAVCIASIYLDEGQPEKALEIALALSRYKIEYPRIQRDFAELLSNTRAALPEGRFEAAMQQVEGGLSPEQAKAAVLAYVQEHLP